MRFLLTALLLLLSSPLLAKDMPQELKEWFKGILPILKIIGFIIFIISSYFLIKKNKLICDILQKKRDKLNSLIILPTWEDIKKCGKNFPNIIMIIGVITISGLGLWYITKIKQPPDYRVGARARYEGMPKEYLKKLGFTKHTLIDYRKEGNKEYMTFSDWTTLQKGDTITFIIENGKVKEWFKENEIKDKQDVM